MFPTITLEWWRLFKELQTYQSLIKAVGASLQKNVPVKEGSGGICQGFVKMLQKTRTVVPSVMKVGENSTPLDLLLNLKAPGGFCKPRIHPELCLTKGLWGTLIIGAATWRRWGVEEAGCTSIASHLLKVKRLWGSGNGSGNQADLNCNPGIHPSLSSLV